ncbi:GTP cyclohydrolase FolE2 [Pseudodonghicola flavimaris]|uniref:GTP cyclohydrolase FolE2 n=1 Tax=Pseudodonghicola flavimaris TaxID=3050036 RepID=A0ABT7F1W1_9RHOB|nr:GTP cyclohydrolase FolE2 [Pseudodonghicola flavimaris]MDK3018595.1 GTP cyclohydrolase FolE2 [Pseudodonghicola flavimaris]
MNVHVSEATRFRQDGSALPPEISEALDRLRGWAQEASPGQLADLGLSAPELSREYPAGFIVDAAYRAGLPDLQNGPASLIRGTPRRIQHVGISNFRLPIRYRCRAGGEIALETSVTGTVSLEADRKGINMSRIMRSFYGHAERVFGFEVIEAALDSYQTDLDSLDARILMRLRFPMQMRALRSGLSGWQYYDIGLEVIDRAGQRLRVMHLDYVYSSTCPCSLELSEHARRTRGQLATPHSQRSVARLSAVVRPGAALWIEDMVDLARAAVPTETQVMVKREDEQAFAELNAANPIFVEDAARLFCEALRGDDRLGDFRVVASHQESLHSHDAVSILTEGPTFEQISHDPGLFPSLHHPG